jgi:DNA-binding MarR family transcriptional regulator
MPDDAKQGGKAERAARRRARAVRAFVFMSRLFEYECRELGVSMAQYRMLLYLRHGPKRAGELAARASITRPSLSTLIAAMERMGLLRRSSVDVDKRGVHLELTRKGEAAIERVESRFGEIFEDAAKDCDRERLVESLNELTRVLNEQIEARVRPED